MKYSFCIAVRWLPRGGSSQCSFAAGLRSRVYEFAEHGTPPEHTWEVGSSAITSLEIGVASGGAVAHAAANSLPAGARAGMAGVNRLIWVSAHVVEVCVQTDTLALPLASSGAGSSEIRGCAHPCWRVGWLATMSRASVA